MICVKDECYGLLPFRSNKPQYFLSINVPSACDAYDNNIHFTNPHPRDMAEKRKKSIHTKLAGKSTRSLFNHRKVKWLKDIRNSFKHDLCKYNNQQQMVFGFDVRHNSSRCSTHQNHIKWLKILRHNWKQKSRYEKMCDRERGKSQSDRIKMSWNVVILMWKATGVQVKRSC